MEMQMKTSSPKIKKTALFACAAILFALLIGCEEYDKYQYYGDRTHVENNTLPFDAAYRRRVPLRHIVVFFEVVKESLYVSPDSAIQVRPGRLSYRTATAGDFLVIYKDIQDVELGRYAREDPRYIRSYDIETNRRRGLYAIQEGTIEILLPYDTRIHTIEVGRKGEASVSYNIKDKIFGVTKTPHE
jgi:hypothetical protein